MHRLMQGFAFSLIALSLASAPAWAEHETPAAAPATKPARPAAARPATRPMLDYSAPPLPAGDPMVWHAPATMPAIVDPLNDAEYARRSTTLKLPEKFDVDEAARRPRLAVVASYVSPEGSAAQAGMKAGDKILAMNGEPLHYDWQFEVSKQPNEDNVMAIVSADGTRRRMSVPPGKMGINTKTVWDAAASWAQVPKRDERFDGFVGVASAAYERDPVLARSAIARAQKAGYADAANGGILGALAAITDIETGRFDEGLELGAMALRDLPSQEKTLLVSRMKYAAAASFKLQYCLDLDAEAPDLPKDEAMEDHLRSAIDSWRKQPDRNQPNPREELRNFDFRDASAELASLMPKGKEYGGSAQIADRLRKNGNANFSAPAGHYHFCQWGPAGANVDIAMEFSFTPTDQTSTQFARVVGIGLTDDDNVHEPLVELTCYDTGVVTGAAYSSKLFEITPPPPPDGHHRIRLIAVDRRCEVILDGVRIFHGPVFDAEHDRRMCLAMKVVGLKMTIYHYHWRVAGERKKQG